MLTRTVDLKFEAVPAVVYSCFVLHNFCESKNCFGLDEEEIEGQIKRHRLQEQNNINLPNPMYSNNTSEGEYIRSILTNYTRTYARWLLNTTEIILSCSQQIDYQQICMNKLSMKKKLKK